MLTSRLSKGTRYALDLIFPMHCAGCLREGGIICPACIKGLVPLSQPYCRVCAEPNTDSPCRWCRENPLSVDGIRSPFLMDGALKESIHSLKYHDIRAAAP